MNTDDMLLHVREAYAFLHGFHTRLRDVVDLFVGGLDERQYLNADTVRTQKPSFQSNPHDRWIWDLFPSHAYYVSYIFTLDGVHAIADLRFDAFRHVGKPHNTDTVPADYRSWSTDLVVTFWQGDKIGEDELKKFWEKSGRPSKEKVLEMRTEFGKTVHVWSRKLDLSQMTSEATIREAAERCKTDFLKARSEIAK